MPLPATRPRGATRQKHHEMRYILDCRMAMSLRPGLYSNSAPEVKPFRPPKTPPCTTRSASGPRRLLLNLNIAAIEVAAGGIAGAHADGERVQSSGIAVVCDVNREGDL
jgi:hypothetical protein